MAKFNRVRNNLALGVHLDQFEATIQIEGRPNVETFFGAILSGATRGRLGMDENTTTNRTQGCFVEIERTVEEFPS